MLTYELDRTNTLPLYDQLYRHIRADIECGALASGARLPSKRMLARHLGISRITVEGAFAQLAAEGYVTAEERKGHFVVPFEGAAAAPGTPRNRTPAAPGSIRSKGFSLCPAPSGPAEPDETPAASAPDAPLAPDPLLADLTGATAPTGLFPYQHWARTLRAVLADGSEETLLSAAQPQGFLPLRRALAQHLRGFRGMDATPGQIVIGAGAQVLYQLIAQLLPPDACIALEDPGYPRLARIYGSLGVRTCAVPPLTDAHAFEQLRATDATAVHCMPSHHFPTGATMPAPVRSLLITWAQAAPGRFVIEDDYDCEFRMQGKPIPPLAARNQDQVIYLNTFTKSLGAAFRIGYMVLPPTLAERFRTHLGFYSCTVGGMDQATLCRFMETGAYERHCNRLRTHYRRVSRQLAQALEEAIRPHGGSLANVGAGLHFTMHLPHVRTECAQAAFLQELANAGVRMNPLSAYRRTLPSDDADMFLVSFSSVDEPAIPRIADALRTALACRSHSSVPS